MAFRIFSASRTFWLVMLVAVAIVALAMYQLGQSRHAIWHGANTINQNLLTAVAHVLEQRLETIDRSLAYTVRQLEANQGASKDEAGALFSVPAVAEHDQMFVLDADGLIIHAMHEDQAPKAKRLASRDVFLSHTQPDAPDVFYSKPFVSDNADKPCMAISRAWRHADGSLGGVAVYSFRLDSMTRLLAEFEVGADSGLNVWGMDGSAIITFPYDQSPWDGSLEGTTAFEQIRSSSHGSFTSMSPIEGSYRLYNFRRLDQYPFVITTVQSVAGIMAGWRYMAYWQAALLIALLAICLLLARRVNNELRAHRITNKRLQRARSSVQTILESLPAMVGYWDKNLVNQFSNAAHEKWFRLKPEQIQGVHLSDLLDKDQFVLMEPYIRRVLEGQTQEIEISLRHPDGYSGHFIAMLVPDRPRDRVAGFFALINDITGRKAAEETLRQEKERFHVTLEGIRDGVLTTDDDGLVTYINPAASAMTGWPPDQAIGRAIDVVVRLKDSQGRLVDTLAAIHVALDRRRTVRSDDTHSLTNEHGSVRQIDGSASPIFDNKGRQTGAVVLLQDVTQARAAAHRMTRLAQHDPLTGLPNRRLLLRLISQALAGASRYSHRVGLLYLDLDGFKHVNDSLGHSVGDALLKKAGERFSQALREEDTLARVGGDEFVVLMQAISDVSEAVALAQRLLDTSQAPYEVGGQAIRVTASIGICVFPDAVLDRDALIHAADQAMYQAKKAGRNQYAVFTSQENPL